MRLGQSDLTGNACFRTEQSGRGRKPDPRAGNELSIGRGAGVVRPAGAAEDTALFNRVARGGGRRPHPNGQGRLARPNPAGPENKSGVRCQAKPTFVSHR